MAVSKSLVLLAMFRSILGQDPTESCTLSFDGRIPNNAEPALFVSNASPFNPKFDIGQNLTWDQIIEFPNVPPSRFDNNGTKPIGLSLSDKSIFASSSEGQEVALRRAELLVNGKNETVSGHKTWHISLRTDPTRPLNYTHEYVLVFHEAQDFQADFCSVKTGSHLEDNPPTSQKMLRVEGYKFDVPVKTFFETPLTDDVWHNFGINLDFPNK
ncbi:putative conserved hypothetical protein [Colletotrichum sublineola]|uniref:Glycoside hydrolase 131 catalytic N-terminal domain-containing protein n=1 Tax=Colletotrichum sublineola TaxID=1173701 RepID=A0A066WZH1_COLSU|nr:putative conserved hypothetical protein [Colletotrichum sublineola]